MSSSSSSLYSLQASGGSPAIVAEMSAMLFGSESSYSIMRKLAALAVDWLEFSKLKQWPPQQNGKVSQNLGAEFLDALGTGQHIVLKKIYYCQQTLSHLMSKTPVRATSTAVSEWELQTIKKIQLEEKVIYIKAEKASEPKPGGIFLTEVPAGNIDEEIHRDVKLYSVDCDCKRMPAKDLWDVLKKVRPHYSLRDANCWDYAVATAKHILMRCAKVPGLSAAEKQRLLTERDSVPENIAKRHIFNNVKKLVEFIRDDWNDSDSDESE